MIPQSFFPVAFATDTVYGLGAPLNDSDALDRLYALKERPHRQPMQILVADRAMATRWIEVGENDPIDVQSRIYPLHTQVIADIDARLINEGGVAVRLPRHDELCAYIADLGVPLVATSANKRGEPALCDARAVREAFPDLALVVTGECRGTASSVWDMRTHPPTRLR